MHFRSGNSFASWTASATSTKRDDTTTPVMVLEKSRPTIHLPSDGLPPPVSFPSDVSSPGRRSRHKKNARVSAGLRVHWDRFVRKLGSGTAPSSSSNFDESVGESSGYPRSRIGGPVGEMQLPQDDRVDEVVVDREWSDEIKSSSVTHSEHGGTPDKSGSNHLGGTNTDRDSFAIRPEGFWGSCRLLIFLRWRMWPASHGFFCTKFLDEKSEMHYNKENWFLRKNLALWSSAFLIVNWAFGIGFTSRPLLLADEIFLYGIAPAFSFAISPMVVYDWPRDRTVIYQVILVISVWIWSVYQVIFIYLCGQYNMSHSFFNCHGKDFLTLFYYTSALQTIALFGLKLHRFPAMMGACVFFVLACTLILPDRPSFVRNLVNFLFFQGFLLYIHYMRENAERRLYTLRDQLKVQFRATQKAQVNERKASDSKRRLTSYVFHEVRVPLNTALLAVQNMQASGTVTQDIEFKALEGSLSMMSKVLNDVLDFNRMDSGRFESVLKPYKFHQVMRSLFVPLRMATDARKLEFVTDLDHSIDQVARRALYEAMTEPEDEIAAKLQEHPDEDGIVVGDETRLRQIITNLASNACKFTPTGGKLTIKTKLVIPDLNPPPDDDIPDEADPNAGADLDTVEGNGVRENGSGQRPSLADGPDVHRLSKSHLTQHNDMHAKPAPPLEWIVVRIEVSDTGCGIRPKDMVQSKLFSAFNQTEQGRLQGGKGTGLGLALVRQIVKLSGGRLGVQSKVGEGSTFWVELPLGVGIKAVPALTSPADLDDDEYGSPRQAVYSSGGKNASMSKSYSSSALHGIMEQAGLVEISTKPTEGPPTRTIGDPSTGTEAQHLNSDDSPPPPERPALGGATKSSDSARGLRLTHLPKPRAFSIDGSFASSGPSVSAGTSPTSPLAPSHLGPGANGETAKLSVLVVDDDPLTRKLMSRMLTRMGCQVTTAENGEIALDLILHGVHEQQTPSSEDTGSGGLSLDVDGGQGEGSTSTANCNLLTEGDGDGDGEGDGRYAVVFLDNQMPVLSGLETVAKLRALHRQDFVVGVTGNALLSDQQEYLDAGVDHVLTKPVLEKSLKSMLVIAEDRRKRRPPTPEPHTHTPLSGS